MQGTHRGRHRSFWDLHHTRKTQFPVRIAHMSLTEDQSTEKIGQARNQGFSNMDVGQKVVRKVGRDVWEQLGNVMEGTEGETSE